jgi:hypothetical protein
MICAKQILNPFNYLASLTRRLQKSAIVIFSKNIQFIFTPRGSLFPNYNIQLKLLPIQEIKSVTAIY